MSSTEPGRTKLPPRAAPESTKPVPVPEHRRCSFDHSTSEDRGSLATHEFVVKVDGKEVTGRLCGKHRAAALERDENKMIELGKDTPVTQQLARDIHNRGPGPYKSNPELIESHLIKDPPGREIGLETPTAPAPTRSLGGYDGRTTP